MFKPYDWAKTFSYDAPITGVFGARDIGKTFGLREQMLRDYFKDGWGHVEICRYSKAITGVCAGYFDKVVSRTRDKALAEKLKDARFRYQGRDAYIGFPVEFDEDGEPKKYKWDRILRVIALTDAQDLKKQTFTHVRRVVMDEAILDKHDRYHDYLPAEYVKFVNVIDTITRQQPGEETDVRVYLLGNALDLFNPYFAHFGINEMPPFGYRWYGKKLFLMHYVAPGEYAQAKLDNTLAGRMMQGTGEEESAAFNKFNGSGSDFIAKKTPRARFAYGLVWQNEKFGVWLDETEGLYFVNRKIVENTEMPIYALSTADHKPNYIVAKRATRILQNFVDGYCYGIVKFDTPGTRERFNEILAMFGVR